MNAAAIGLLASIAIVVGTYLLVYTMAGIEHGYSLFSARRARALWTGKVECVGGPFDGCTLPVPRRDLLGLGGSLWPDVLYDATARTYRFGDRMTGVTPPFTTAWAGYYQLRFMSDRYEYHDTGLVAYADEFAQRGAA